MRRVILGVVIAIVGCASDDAPALSCEEVVTHFYRSGCTYIDTRTNTPISQAEVTRQCKDTVESLPARCRNELDDWLTCQNEVPDPAMTDEQCDCTTELVSLASC